MALPLCDMQLLSFIFSICSFCGSSSSWPSIALFLCDMTAFGAAGSCVRSRSAPTHGSWRDKPAARPVTLSCEDSPTAYSALSRIHFSMCTEYLCTPRLVVEEWHHTFYVMLQPRWSIPDPHMLQPTEWHATLLRGKLSSQVDAIEITIHLQTKMDNFLRMLIEEDKDQNDAHANGDEKVVKIALADPPWNKSWTFGMDNLWLARLEASRHYALSECLKMDPGFKFQEHRPLHMSWL